MIVFKKYTVGKIISMICCTTYLNGIFFKRAHIRSSLASVKKSSICTLKLFHIFSCHCGNAAHTLKIIKTRSFPAEDCLYIAVNNAQKLTLFNLVAVLEICFKASSFIKKFKRSFKNTETADNTVLLTDKFSLTLLVLRHNSIG